jgi:hypothetical protein
MPDTKTSGWHLFPKYMPDARIDGDPVAKIEPVTKTHSVQTDHSETSTTTTTDGHHVAVESDTESSSSLSGEFDDRVKRLIMDAQTERQRIEDKRANRRNQNRLYTLLGAIVIGIAVVQTLPHLGHVGVLLSPYSFIITVALDTAITLYALLRHY